MKPIDIITKLEQLEYFKFLKEEDVLDYKNCLIENIENGWLDMPNQVLIDLKRGNGIQRNKPESIDRRSNVVDGEYLFRGGLETTLKKFQAIFESRNLKFELSNNSEEYSDNNQYLKHKITVNGIIYQVFDGMMERGTSEMDYLKSIHRPLNEELKEQEHANEQFRVLTSM